MLIAYLNAVTLGCHIRMILEWTRTSRRNLATFTTWALFTAEAVTAVITIEALVAIITLRSAL